MISACLSYYENIAVLVYMSWLAPVYQTMRLLLCLFYVMIIAWPSDYEIIAVIVYVMISAWLSDYENIAVIVYVMVIAWLSDYENIAVLVLCHD